MGDGELINLDVAAGARALGASVMASLVAGLVTIGAAPLSHPLKANSRAMITAARITRYALRLLHLMSFPLFWDGSLHCDNSEIFVG